MAAVRWNLAAISSRTALRGFAGAVLVACFQLGCTGSVNAGAATPGAGGLTKRDTTVTHEACDTSGAEKTDANGDGKPDIFSVKSGGREVCRAVDLNFDGLIDAYTYFDGSGQIRRRESDYDRDGQIDEIAIYKSGQVAEKDQATTLAKHLDTWDFYQAGVLVRSERDSNGDGIIDQWWEYPKPECPLIHADVNADGRPDPGATIDYCKETGYTPPERASDKAATSPKFEQQGALPTELENKPSDKADDKKPDDKKPAAPATSDAKKGPSK
jgi:hypothetical protein